MYYITFSLAYREHYLMNELDIEVRKPDNLLIRSINMGIYLGEVLYYIKNNMLAHTEKPAIKKLGPYDDATVIVLIYNLKDLSPIYPYMRLLIALYKNYLHAAKLSSKEDVDEYCITKDEINNTLIRFLKYLNKEPIIKKSIIEKIKYIVGV